MNNPSDKDRFMSKVAKSPTGCWLWTGSTSAFGYGNFKFEGQCHAAHRMMWRFEHGAFSDKVVCHRCDVPACVNPDHLFEGTHADNVRDRVAKNRSATGTRNGRSKLVEADVVEIRRLLIEQDGPTKRAIASRFGVDQKVITKIERRENWKHVP